MGILGTILSILILLGVYSVFNLKGQAGKEDNFDCKSCPKSGICKEKER